MKNESQVSEPAITKLSSCIFDRGPILVWAVLVEDTYETIFGDGYYAYLESTFFDQTKAEVAAALRTDWTKRHMRHYELKLLHNVVHMSPCGSDSEPITVEALAKSLHESGLV